MILKNRFSILSLKFSNDMEKVTKKAIRTAIYAHDVTALYRYYFKTTGTKANDWEIREWISKQCNNNTTISNRAARTIDNIINDSHHKHISIGRTPDKIRQYFYLHDIIRDTIKGCNITTRYTKLPYVYTIERGNKKTEVIIMCSPKFKITDYNKYTFAIQTPRQHIIGDMLERYRVTHYDYKQ